MSTATRARPKPTFDHLKKKKPLEVHDWIPLNDDATELFDRAKNELQMAELSGEEKRLEAAKAVYDEAQQAMRDNSVEVIFRSIGRPAYDKLQKEHPPTEAQIEQHKKDYGAPAEYNADTFAPVLISVSCVQPEMTPEQVTELITEHGWNAAEYAHLFNLAMRVNTQRRVANLAF